MSNLKGKIALITGASSGIGAATAVHFTSLGCKVALTGRNAGNLERTAKDCGAIAQGTQILKVLGDVSNEEDRQKIIQATIDYFGQLDILVNNAGIIANGTTENTTLESFDQMMNVNVRSVFHLTQLAIPYLKKTKGSIVNVSSIAGLRSFPGIMAYCASKAAVDQMTKCTALELAEDGVSKLWNPGVIVTEIHKRGGMSEEAYAKFLERAKETHALGRPGTVDEVAKAIAFLADNNTSSFITGVNLPVDGGRGQQCVHDKRSCGLLKIFE